MHRGGIGRLCNGAEDGNRLGFGRLQVVEQGVVIKRVLVLLHVVEDVEDVVGGRGRADGSPLRGSKTAGLRLAPNQGVGNAEGERPVLQTLAPRHIGPFARRRVSGDRAVKDVREGNAGVQIAGALRRVGAKAGPPQLIAVLAQIIKPAVVGLPGPRQHNRPRAYAVAFFLPLGPARCFAMAFRADTACYRTAHSTLVRAPGLKVALTCLSVCRRRCGQAQG